MDPEYIINRDDIGTTASSSSLSSPLLSIRGGGDEQQQDIEISQNSEFETTQVTNSTRCNCHCGWFHNIPTLAYILVPMILIFIAMFLAAVFIPR